MQAALTRAFAYAQQRRVFGKSVSEYPLTVAKLLRMAALLLASREFTHAVAALMDDGPADMQASLVKLFSCRAAEYVTREAMQIHGGMGYAEASDVSRYYVDARVLSIFEGAEETLALKVVARDLIKNA
jgi:(2S)-methylsuccinyl-CoA dehydrogenase